MRVMISVALVVLSMSTAFPRTVAAHFGSPVGLPAAGADGPCFDNGNRYVVCGNGTVTDTVTGLIWLKQWNCLDTPLQPSNQWAAANGAAAALKNGQCGLSDHSSPGDWRLPTRDEWIATMARAVGLGCVGASGPALTDNAGTACYSSGAGSSFSGVPNDFRGFWSSTAFDVLPYDAWAAQPNFGSVSLAGIKGDSNFHMWPVRGGSH